MLASLRGLCFLACLTPCTVILGTLSLLDRRHHHMYTRLWGRIGLFLSRTRVIVEGAEQLPSAASIVIANHASGFDILALVGYFPRPLTWVAKESLFHIPIFGHALRSGGHIPMNRTQYRDAHHALDAAYKRLTAGANVLVFPEGTRTTDGHLLPFKRGAFVLAHQAKVPIVPLSIDGSFAVNPGGTFHLTCGKTIVLRIHQSTYMTDGSRAEIETIRQTIAQGVHP